MNPFNLKDGRGKWRKSLVAAFFLISVVVLFPLSVRIADPFFTRPFRPGWSYPVLLVWPDRVEVRWVQTLAEVSPRPKDATYSFNVSPERQNWVLEQVHKIRYPNSDAVLRISVKQLGPDRQRIQLESWADGFIGLIYEARPNAILPLRTRAAGPGSSIIILAVHALVCGSLWFAIWAILRRKKLSKSA